MLSLIFWIFIIWIIWRNVKKNRPEGQSGYGKNGLSQTKKDSDSHKGIAEYGEAMKKTAQKAVHPKPGSTQTKAAAAGTQAGSGKEVSTTEYLRQKALEDEREHAEEARREAMRLHRETGGRPAAQRHFDGDSVPKGMRLVKCSYCGAENLIAGHHNQKDYTCYFCREIL